MFDHRSVAHSLQSLFSYTFFKLCKKKDFSSLARKKRMIHVSGLLDQDSKKLYFTTAVLVY
jgi:hypothetical protein